MHTYPDDQGGFHEVDWGSHVLWVTAVTPRLAGNYPHAIFLMTVTPRCCMFINVGDGGQMTFSVSAFHLICMAKIPRHLCSSQRKPPRNPCVGIDSLLIWHIFTLCHPSIDSCSYLQTYRSLAAEKPCPNRPGRCYPQVPTLGFQRRHRAPRHPVGGSGYAFGAKSTAILDLMHSYTTYPDPCAQ